MSTKFKSVGPVGPAAGDGGPWSEDDKRELRLVLMADQLSQMAYQVVDWGRVAALGRAIVALAEKVEPRPVQ
jgi:hypothetical protein